MKFVLPGKAPSVNSAYRSSRGAFHKSAKTTAWQRDAYWLIKSQRHDPTLSVPVKASLDLYMPDKRANDIDNPLKAILDVLELSEVILNDSLIEQLYVRKLYDKINPRIEIEITAM